VRADEQRPGMDAGTVLRLTAARPPGEGGLEVLLPSGHVEELRLGRDVEVGNGKFSIRAKQVRRAG